MSPDEFRRHGHQVVDWIADFLDKPDRFPVASTVAPGQLTDSLPGSGPERGEPMEAILEDFHRLIVPATTQWNHPGFMAYFATTATGPGILGEMLAAGLNSNGILWASSPAVTELEQVTLDWLRQWMGLPEPLFGVIFDTASTSTMHAIAAARQHVDPETRSLGGSRGMVLYTSEQAHSSVEKGAMAIGLGQDCVRRIAVDAAFQMLPAELEAAIESDLRAGLRPFCVVPTAGTTSTTSIDPLPRIAPIAERYGLWIHLDAAYAGTAAVAPELRHVLESAERADSIVVNPHKWMGVPLDLSVLYTRKPEALRRAFSLIPDYLASAEDPRAVNLMEYGVPLGRRFRALKLWFVMRYYGREGIAARIRDHVGWAKELARDISADSRFELCAPVPLSLVCFRLKGEDTANRDLLDRVNGSGLALLSKTTLHGRFVLRLAIGNHATTREHVWRAWEALKALI